MQTHKAEVIFNEIRALPESVAEEVLDFIFFLKEKSDNSGFTNLMKAQSKSFSDIWNNKEDDVWNGC